MGDELDFGLAKPTPPKDEEGSEQQAKTIVNKGLFTDDKIEELMKQAVEETTNAVPEFVAMIIGKDGTGKTGIYLDYCMGLPKKTLILDLDSGVRPIYNTYHRSKDTDHKIVIPRIYEKKDTGEDIIPNYENMFVKIKAFVLYVDKHTDEFSAIVIDGISTLLKYCEYLMRLDKNIAPDGGVNLRYWLQRNKRFIELLDFMKAIPNIDKFYVGHEDFIQKDDSAAVIAKTSQMIHQRIICSKITDKTTGDVSFRAKIDKSKFNLKLEGKEYEFATVKKDGTVTWQTAKIFESLK